MSPALEEFCLANIYFLSRTDNNAISGSAPSVYRAKIRDVDDILNSNLMPESIFTDDYAWFLQYCSELLLNAATPC